MVADQNPVDVASEIDHPGEPAWYERHLRTHRA
jgi:hypothetical protein